MTSEEMTTTINLNQWLVFQPPLEIFREIKEFLRERDYYNLVSSTRHPFFILMKRQSRKLYLHGEDTIKFLNNIPFQEEIYSKIHDPYHQLHLKSPSSIYFPKLLKIPSCELFLNPALGIEKEMNWSNDCDNRKLVVFLRNQIIEEIPSVPNLTKMILFDFPRLTNISRLGHLKKLCLMNCPQVIDVNMLSKVHHLMLIRCHGVTDVSQLGKVRWLYLDDCPNVLDLAGLTNNYRLTIHRGAPINKMKNIQKIFNATILETDLIQTTANSMPSATAAAAESIEFVKKVRILQLLKSDYTMLPLPFQFNHLFTVTIKDCQQFTSTAGLYAIPVLTIMNCRNLMDISGLGGNKVVHLENCPLIESFSSLQRVKKVSIISCDKFQNGFDLQYCQLIELVSLPLLKDLSMFSDNCQSFQLTLGKINPLSNLLNGHYQGNASNSNLSPEDIQEQFQSFLNEQMKPTKFEPIESWEGIKNIPSIELRQCPKECYLELGPDNRNEKIVIVHDRLHTKILEDLKDILRLEEFHIYEEPMFSRVTLLRKRQ